MDQQSTKHPQFDCFDREITRRKDDHRRAIAKYVKGDIGKNIEEPLHYWYKLAMYIDILEELIEVSMQLPLSDSCLEAFTKMAYCQTCGDLDKNYKRVQDSKRMYVAKHRSCKNFCFNVMRGCLTPTYYLQPKWEEYHTDLMKFRMQRSSSDYENKLLSRIYNDLNNGLRDFRDRLAKEKQRGIKIGEKLVATLKTKCKITIKKRPETDIPLSSSDKSGEITPEQIAQLKALASSRAQRQKPFHHTKRAHTRVSRGLNPRYAIQGANDAIIAQRNQQSQANPNLRIQTNKADTDEVPGDAVYEAYQPGVSGSSRSYDPEEENYDDYEPADDIYPDYDYNNSILDPEEAPFYYEDGYDARYLSVPDDEHYPDGTDIADFGDFIGVFSANHYDVEKIKGL